MKRLDYLLLILLIVIMLSIILGGCATLSQSDKDYYDHYFKDFKQHHSEPQIPEPRP